MPSQYSSRRASSSNYLAVNSMRSAHNAQQGSNWAPNRNRVRNSNHLTIGPLWSMIFTFALVAVLGVLYVTQSAGVTTFDHKIADVNSEIVNLEAERDALAVENAKIHALAVSEGGNEVASSMIEAENSGFVGR